MCTILSHEKINLQEMQINSDLLEFMVLDIMEFDDMLGLIENEDYKKITLSINNNEYTLYHGFPGDAPVGCIFIESKYIVNLGYGCLGRDMYIPNEESIPSKYVDDIKNIKEWYKSITQNMTSFDDKFFY